MIVVYTFFSPEDAWTAQSLLSAHGLEAEILDNHTLSVLPLDSIALGGYRLAVPKHQVQHALELLVDQYANIPDPQHRQYFGDEYEDEQSRLQRRAPLRPFLIFGAAIVIFILLTGGARNIGFDWLF